MMMMRMTTADHDDDADDDQLATQTGGVASVRDKRGGNSQV